MPSEVIALAEKPLTAKEKELIVAMTRPGSTIEVVVPDDINPKDWLVATSVTCRVILRAQMQEQQLIPVLGRLLMIAKANPAIWTENGYEGFDAFVEGEVRQKWGVSRSTCYEAAQHAEFAAKAALTTEDYKQIGRVKMREIVKVIPDGDEGKASTKKLIEAAREMPVAEFREHLDKKYHVEAGSSSGAFLRIPTNKAIEKRWKKFVEDPDIQAYVGSGKADKILDRMMEECGPEWKSKSTEKSEAEKGAA